MSGIFSLLHSVAAIMTPLLFAATGGLFCELAGMLNIALEGLLLTGAFFAAAALYFSGSLAAALAAAVFASMLLALVLSAATIWLRSNVFITGLAANLFSGGVTAVISHYLFGTRGVVALNSVQPPRLWGYSLFSYGSLLLLFTAWLAIYRTPFGYRLRACGKYAGALASLGIKPDSYRFAAFLISGFYCGLGGAFLSLNLGAFVPNMSAGKGWIALVVIFLGSRRPRGLLAAAFVFSLAEAFSNYAQGLFNVPADFVLAMPYLVTLAAMIAVSAWSRRKNAG